MNQYTFSSLIAFILLSMGLTGGILGTVNYFENTKSKSGRQMFCICWSVFFWNFGYAWMSMCYGDDFAYIARGIALLAVIFYIFFVIRYVTTVTKYPVKKSMTILAIFEVMGLVSWTQIIKKTAVYFTITPWGYWYIGSMSWARILQFVSILGIIVEYNVIIHYGRKQTIVKRDLYVLKRFGLFSPILLFGCALDTFIPSVFHTAAVPGSCIAAFASSMVLYNVSRKNKTFGASVTNISGYVFNDVSIPVIVTNQRGEVVLYNAFSLSFLECSELEIKKKRMSDFFQEDEGFYNVLGAKKVCKIDKTDVYDDFDELLYSIYFVQDITKEREHVKMLNESREIAEKANQAKSEFLANMSHEIRTPLNAVLGIDEMIIRESKDDNIIDYAQNIKQAGTMLLSIINDILDFSKIESGKMDITNVESEAPEVISDIILLIEKKAAEKNLEFIIDMDPNLPSKLYGDDVRMRQILINILNNSIKYTQKGSITLKSELVEIVGDEAITRTSVIDTGVGIKEEDLESLFDAFKRVDIEKNRNIEGSGLGLSITNKLLNLMGSELKVKSEYGKGSVFYFEIKHRIMDPTPIGNFNETAAISKKPKSKESTLFTAPTANILIVDDNKINLKVASGLLKRSKVLITTAQSGPESIELVKNNKFDIIFMDHMMPDMDGVEAVSIIQGLEDNMSREAVIIALTANAISGAKEMFLENGFDDFIAKPIEVKELEAKLLKYLPEEKVIRE